MTAHLIKDIVKYLPTAIVPAIVGFISVPVLTRLFLPDDYGNYTLVISTVNILTILNAWLSMSIIRFLPQYEKENRLEEFVTNIVQTSAISITVIAVVFLGILLATSAWGTSPLHSMMYLGVAMFALSALFEILQRFLQSRRQVRQYCCFLLWRVITTFVFGLAFVVWFRCGVVGMFYGMLVSLALAIPALLARSVGTVRLWPIRISPEMIREMGKYSVPLVVGNLAAWILGLSDRYILNWLRSADEVGIYSASYNISERSIMLLVSVFLMAFAPLIVRAWEHEGKEATQAYLTKTTRLFLMVCVPAVVGLSVLGKPVIGLLTHEAYASGYRIVPLVAGGALLLGLQQIYSQAFVFRKRTYMLMVALLLSGGLNVVANVLLVPQYGYMAAAATTCVCYAVSFALVAGTSRHYLTWTFPKTSLIRILIASTIMGGAAYWIGRDLTSFAAPNVIAAIVSGIGIYVLALFLLRELDLGDLTSLLALRREQPS